MRATVKVLVKAVIEAGGSPLDLHSAVSGAIHATLHGSGAPLSEASMRATLVVAVKAVLGASHDHMRHTSHDHVNHAVDAVIKTVLQHNRDFKDSVEDVMTGSELDSVEELCSSPALLDVSEAAGGSESWELLADSRNCFLPHTLVRIPAQSFKRAQDLKVGDVVAMHSGGFTEVTERIALAKDSARLTKLVTRHAEFHTSSENLFPARDGARKQACELSKGEHVLVQGAAGQPAWQKLTAVETYEEHTEHVQLSFKPDAPVEAFLAEPGAHSRGQAPETWEGLLRLWHDTPEANLTAAMPRQYDD